MKTLLLAILLAVPSYPQLKKQADTATKADDRVEDLVRIRLAGDRDTGGAGRIKVIVKDGAVTLQGKVESERQKSRAEHLTKRVRGVRSVTNKLVVEPR